MRAITFQEINSFFSSLTGYLVLIVFLIVNGLLLWVLDSEYNILQGGYADLSSFFRLTPLIFVFLIPALTMKSFSEEIKEGTIELLLTKPLSIWEVVLGKFLGVFFLSLIALIPTLLYITVLKGFVVEGMLIDYGRVLGSYMGLVFLIAAYTSMGIFASVLTSNQVISFIVGLLICGFFSVGIEGIASLNKSMVIAQFGVIYHFKSIGKGVLDSRDLLYFVSITILFLNLTVYRIKQLYR